MLAGSPGRVRAEPGSHPDLDDPDWIPRTGGGKQKTPNVIRGEITRFLATKEMTQTAWLSSIGINSNTFGRFMRGKYKDQWSAVSNGCYWAAARDLERRRRDAKAAAKRGKKRSAGGAASGDSASSRASKKQRCADELARINAVGLETEAVYDNCDTVRTKLTRFFIDSGITKSAWLSALSINSNSLNSFMRMKGKGAGGANKCYRLGYHFLERKRILDGRPKSKARLAAEQRYGAEGYSLRHDDGKRWVFGGAPVDPRIFDIDYLQDRRNNSA